MAPAAGELLHYPRTRTLPSLKYVSLLVFSCIAVILPCPSASSSPSYYGAPKIAPPISHTQSGSNVKADQQEGQVSAWGDTGAGSASTVVIDADEIIDEMAAASRGSDGGGSATEEGGEGVYKSTQVYRQPQSSTSTPQQLIARGRRAKRRRCVCVSVEWGWVARRQVQSDRCRRKSEEGRADPCFCFSRRVTFRSELSSELFLS